MRLISSLFRRGHLQRFIAAAVLLLANGGGQLCNTNPGFPEPLTVTTPLAALVAWWRGDATFADARRQGLAVTGPRPLARAFPDWFERYLFADVAAAGRSPG